MSIISECTLCPRMCRVSRAEGQRGFCGEGAEMRVSRVSLHSFEEPPISGTRGSGTIFFSGCTLRCEFCQNKTISRTGAQGKVFSVEELAEAMYQLRDEGAHNINLVTPTHFTLEIIKALKVVKPTLGIPVVYNTSGYERVETLRRLDGLVDIYLPDFKYCSAELAKKYSSAPNYKDVATEALVEMHRQRGAVRIDESGIMSSGVMIRHLVLPSGRKDSIEVLNTIAATVPTEDVLLSLMSQYTPEFALDSPYKELHRRLTSFEYSSVADHAEKLGFNGYFQALSSASSKYTPDFEQK